MSTTVISHTGSQLLEAAYQEPHDPAVALTYADWLDENDRPDHAALVRLQTEHQLWYPLVQGRLDALRHETHLQGEVHRAVAAELPRWDGVGWGFRFGLPVAEAEDFQTYGRYAAELVAAGVPWVRLRRRRGLAAGVDCAALAGVTLLDLSFRKLTPRDVAALASCPHLAGLRWLDLAHTGLTPDGLRVLLASPYLTSIRGLGLSGNRLAGLSATEAPALPHLEALEVGNAGLRLRAACEFAAAVSGGNPLRLRLDRTPHSELGVAGLAGCPALARVAWLDLGGCGVDTEDALALVDSPYLDGVRRLHVAGHDRLGCRGMIALQDRFGGRVSHCGPWM